MVACASRRRKGKTVQPPGKWIHFTVHVTSTPGRGHVKDTHGPLIIQEKNLAARPPCGSPSPWQEGGMVPAWAPVQGESGWWTFVDVRNETPLLQPAGGAAVKDGKTGGSLTRRAALPVWTSWRAASLQIRLGCSFVRWVSLRILFPLVPQSQSECNETNALSSREIRGRAVTEQQKLGLLRWIRQTLAKWKKNKTPLI